MQQLKSFYQMTKSSKSEKSGFQLMALSSLPSSWSIIFSLRSEGWGRPEDLIRLIIVTEIWWSEINTQHSRSASAPFIKTPDQQYLSKNITSSITVKCFFNPLCWNERWQIGLGSASLAVNQSCHQIISKYTLTINRASAEQVYDVQIK